MDKNKLTKNQSLYAIKIFLNMFNLRLEEVEDVDSITKFKIFSKLNEEVGIVNFVDGGFKIESLTKIGYLIADFDIGKLSGFKDIECVGLFGQLSHNIKFNVKGKQDFDGDMRIEVFSDTEFGNNVRVHSKLNYLDKMGNQVEINVMDDGNFFKYVADNEKFMETLLINPADEFGTFMYHIVTNGEYNTGNHCYPYQYVRNVWYNGSCDKNHLKTTSYTIKDLKVIQEDIKLYDVVKKDKIEELFIQRGNLMHNIDKSFAEKVIELFELFKFGDLSFLENLISVSFDKYNDEIKKAWFGTDINKIEYYNGATNLIDAYFNSKDNEKNMVNDIYTRILKKNSK